MYHTRSTSLVNGKNTAVYENPLVVNSRIYQNVSEYAKHISGGGKQ